MIIILWFVVLVLCLLALMKASDWFVVAAKNIGSYLKLSPFVVGTTFVAIGTSLPELVTSIVAVFQGSSEIVIGNVLGSNIANLLLVVGIAAIFARRLKTNKSDNKVNFLLLIFSVLLLIVTLLDGVIGLYESLIFFGCIILYMIYLVKSNKKKNDTKVARDEKIKLNRKSILMFIIALVIIFIASRYTVESIVHISNFFGIGKEIIAATVIAFGTSLPELMVAIATIKRKETDMLIGNILGSNLFNTFAVIGIAGLFGRIVAPASMLITSLIFLVVATALYFLFARDYEISIREGILLLVLYVLFVLQIIGVF